MRFFKSNKVQISIFILIAVMITFLIIFLVNTEVEDKVQVIEKNKELSDSGSNLDSNFIGLKESVDSCLEKELKKSLIIAGARGGFIYDGGEYYFPGVWPNNLYSDSTIKNLGLTSSYLSKSTLVYSRDVPDYIPRYNSNDIYFGSKYFERTIDEDLKRFILNGFIDCLDIEGIKERGYNVSYEQYLGRIESVDFDKITLTGVIGKVNDTVKLDTIENVYFGKIIKVDMINKQTEVEFKDSNIVFPDSTLFTDFNVINENSSVRLNITFQDEAVTASLNFPITISKGDFTSSYKNSEVSVNVRLMQLIKLSRNLISYKYREDHLIDFTNPEVLNEFIEGTKGDKNSYFKTTNNRNLYITKKILKNSDDYKAEIYTIIDYDSKILGEPYVYSFGYENHAPIIDLSRVEDFMLSDEKEGILGRVGKNKLFTYNFLIINNGTIDPQRYDNFRNNWGGANTVNNWTDNYVHFKEQHYVIVIISKLEWGLLLKIRKMSMQLIVLSLLLFNITLFQ